MTGFQRTKARPRRFAAVPELNDKQLLASAAQSLKAQQNKHRVVGPSSQAVDETACPWCFLPITAGDKVVTFIVPAGKRQLHKDCATTRTLKHLGLA